MVDIWAAHERRRAVLRHQTTRLLMTTLLAASLWFLTSQLASAQQGAPQPPEIAYVAIDNGSVLSPAARADLFPEGGHTVNLKGYVQAHATRVEVRLEDFWSRREWHPHKNCPRFFQGRACKGGQLKTGIRFAFADISSRSAFGLREWSFPGWVPDGMYRMSVFARDASGRRGPAETRWIRIARGATAEHAQPRVITRSPRINGSSTQESIEDRTKIRIEASSASVQMDWSLRDDATGRFYSDRYETHQRCGDAAANWDCMFATLVTDNRRDLSGWTSAAGGRNVFSWDLKLSAGRYTMWTTGIDSQGRKGPTTNHSFTVRAPDRAEPTVDLDPNSTADGTLRVGGRTGSVDQADDPKVTFIVKDRLSDSFVGPGATIVASPHSFGTIAINGRWVANLNLPFGTYDIVATATYADDTELESSPEAAFYDPCTTERDCPEPEIDRVVIDGPTRVDPLSFEVQSDHFAIDAYGVWSLQRDSDNRWYNAETKLWVRQWTLNSLDSDPAKRSAQPDSSTTLVLRRGGYHIGVRLFNRFEIQGDGTWQPITVR